MITAMPTLFPRIGKFGDPGIASTLTELYRFLQSRGHEIVLDTQCADFIYGVDVLSPPPIACSINHPQRSIA
jgi:hypothetical protein